jgi:hypothetical protein
MMKKLVVFLPAVLCWGCAGLLGEKALTPQGQAVQIADENIVRQCRYLGDVIGAAGNDAYARNDARNGAAAMRATHVVFVSATPAVITGPNEPNTPAQAMARAYDCATVRTAPPPPSSQ